MTQIIKSVHIKECWPYEYKAPVRRMHTEDAKKRQNELRRARYAKAVSIKTPKREGSKKLLGLKVFEMNDDICEELNNDTKPKTRQRCVHQQTEIDMNDKELIEAIAELWIENGGDRDGFFWSVNKIGMSIGEKEKEKNEASSDSF